MNASDARKADLVGSFAADFSSGLSLQIAQLAPEFRDIARSCTAADL
jgi:hypothetical protein